MKGVQAFHGMFLHVYYFSCAKGPTIEIEMIAHPGMLSSTPDVSVHLCCQECFWLQKKKKPPKPEQGESLLGGMFG